MDFPPSIETARLLLRPATAADLDEWTRLIFADPEVVRYIPSRVTAPRARAERMLAYFEDTWRQHGHGEWLLTERDSGALVGHCGLGFLVDTGEVEIDYALGRPWWGRGLATEAVRASLRFGFEEAGLEQVIGLVVPENTASRRVLAHAGFTYVRDAPYFGLTLAFHTLERAAFQPDAGPYRVLPA